MGGIAGTVRRDGTPVEEAVLRSQSEALAHRGPDGEEVWLNDGVGLVRRADEAVAPGGAPAVPLTDPSGRYRMVNDGCVFNSPEILRELEQCGESPRLPSAGAVMLHAYIRWGVGAFARFNGGFACAIWDAETQTIILARDHLGIKPLLYSVTGGEGRGELVFASEAKGILVHPRISHEPDEHGIANYLSCNRYLFQSDRSFYKGITRLSPGTVLVAGPDGEEFRRYWQLDPERANPFGTFEEAVEGVREIFVDAVDIRMPEDGHLGAALSGGFDSSSVVCVMGHLNGEKGSPKASFDTFSFDFESSEADEPELVDLVASAAGAAHHHTPVLTPDLLDSIDELIWANDGPTLEDSVILLWKKKRNAHRHGVRVLLSGLGGDELFMGRLNYFADLLRQFRWRDLWGEIRGFYPFDKNTGLRTPLSKLLRAYTLAPLEPHWSKNLRKGHLAHPFPPTWLSPALVQRTGVGQTLPGAQGPKFNSVYMRDCYDVFYYELLGAAVPYHDVASSQWAIDTRFPLLDVRLVEAMFAVPREWKIRRGEVRMLQKKAMAPFLPEAILEKHIKMDFHPVLNRFLREAYSRELNPLLAKKSHLSDEFVDWRSVARYHSEFLSGRVSNPYPLWIVSNLERWLRSAFA